MLQIWVRPNYEILSRFFSRRSARTWQNRFTFLGADEGRAIPATLSVLCKIVEETRLILWATLAPQESENTKIQFGDIGFKFKLAHACASLFIFGQQLSKYWVLQQLFDTVPIITETGVLTEFFSYLIDGDNFSERRFNPESWVLNRFYFF